MSVGSTLAVQTATKKCNTQMEAEGQNLAKRRHCGPEQPTRAGLGALGGHSWVLGRSPLEPRDVYNRTS